jgi:hypothetical protein
MSTMAATFIPDYQATQNISGAVGTIASAGNSGVITIGPYKVFKIIFFLQGTPNSLAAIRFSMGNSLGTAAPTPTATSPLLLSNQENFFETNNEYNQINLANLAADNTSGTIAYTILPVSKS